MKDNLKQNIQHLRSLGGGIVLFAVLYLISKTTNITLCPIMAFFNRPCIGCGLTRGFMACFKLEFAEAMQYNVLSVPLFFGVALYCLFVLSDIVLGTQLVNKFEILLSKKYMYVIYIFAIIVSGRLNGVF